MTELVQHQQQNALTDQMDYARAVSAGSLLPREYQGNPANVLIAIGLGQSMGLSPAESMYRITVIQGKPTASAELIAANVRKAGHRLRVQSNDTTCTATIIRSDDPDFEFSVTRDFEWAKAMGLASKDNYKKQPGTMLQWRAITAVARLACPEALYGVSYTPDEIERDEKPATTKSPGVAGLRAAVDQTPPPAPAVQRSGPDEQPAQQQTNDDDPNIEDAVEVPDDEPKITQKQQRHLFQLFKAKGIQEAEQLSGIAHIIGRPIESRTAMTEAEWHQVIDRLEQLPDGGAQVDGGEQQ